MRLVDHPVELVSADQAVAEQLRGRELLIGQKCKYWALIGQNAGTHLVGGGGLQDPAGAVQSHPVHRVVRVGYREHL